MERQAEVNSRKLKADNPLNTPRQPGNTQYVTNQHHPLRSSNGLIVNPDDVNTHTLAKETQEL